MPNLHTDKQALTSGYLILCLERDVDYVCMVDTNEELMPDHLELTPASQAMAFPTIINVWWSAWPALTGVSSWA